MTPQTPIRNALATNKGTLCMKHRISHLVLATMLAALLLPALPAFAQFQNNSYRGNGNNGNRNQNRSNNNTQTQSTSTDGSRQMGTASIQYDQETGSIVVVADDETNERIKAVLENLDRPTPQVLIKVLFLEVTHGDKLDLGVEAQLKDVDGKNVSDLSSAFNLSDATEGGFYKIIEGDFQATLHALATNNKLEVLSRPSVLTRNNQEATITVGQEVPFITNSRITSDGQTINTIQYSDVGIILRVQPRIMPDRLVEMDVAPEISNLTAETVPITNGVTAPVIAKRSAQTSIVVKDGKTVVIGGMIENNVTENVRKIPVIGDIPYLGALFRRTIKEKSKTELLIFLTPFVVENSKELGNLSRAEEKNNNTLAHQVFTEEQLNKFLGSMDAPPVEKKDQKKK